MRTNSRYVCLCVDRGRTAICLFEKWWAKCRMACCLFYIPFLLVFLLLTGKWIWVHSRSFQNHHNRQWIRLVYIQKCVSNFGVVHVFSLGFAAFSHWARIFRLPFSSKRIYSEMFILFRCCLEWIVRQRLRRPIRSNKTQSINFPTAIKLI